MNDVVIEGTPRPDARGYFSQSIWRIASLRLTKAIVGSILAHAIVGAAFYSAITVALHADDPARPYQLAPIYTATLKPLSDDQVITAKIEKDALPLPVPSIPASEPSAQIADTKEGLTTGLASSVSAQSQKDALPAAPNYHPSIALDQPPLPLNNIVPDYPLNDNFQEGTVVLRLLINERGVIDNVAVLRAFPRGVFEAAAIDAFQKAVFSPGKLFGVPVKTQMLIEVKFTPYNRGSMVNGRLN